MIEKYVYKFTAANEAVDRVNLGEEVVFRTLDCFSNQIKRSEDLVTNIDYDHVNPATGPVYVEGVEAGDILVVDIVKVEVDDQGVITTLPHTGPLHEYQETRTKVIPIHEGMATFNDLQFPINPMIGVIGVAPAQGSYPCGFPGAHGGNMDNHLIVEGTRIFFPVQVAGAMFQLGDLHATMGDGEICGTGIEIAGHVTVKLSVIKGVSLNWPVLETEDRWYAIACAMEYNEALINACRAMQQLITRAYGWDDTDAYLYMSVQGDAEICQGCKPCDVDIIIRFGVPKIVGKPLIKA